MEIKTFFDNFKEKFIKIKNTVIDWGQENKKRAILIVGLVSSILICIILLIGVSTKKNKPATICENELELSHDLVTPNGPELHRDYVISRQSKEAWSEEDVKKWFSTPSETDMKGLSKANDNMVDKILGGTP